MAAPMKIEISLSRKIALGFTMGLLILIIIGAVSYLGVREFIRSTAIVTQAHRIMTALEATLGDVVSAESETRGFFITGSNNFFKSYQTSAGEVEQDFTQLHELVVGGHLKPHLDDFERLTHERMARLKKVTEAQQAHGPGTKIDASGSGKLKMDEIRHVVDEMEKSEDQLINERDQAVQKLARHVTVVIVMGSLFAILLAAFSTVVLSVDVAHRERLEREVLAISEREQRRIGQDLHDGVCQHLTGIALLSRSLQQKLVDRAAPEAPEAARITGLVNEGIEQTRRVTHGLHPVANEPTGLMVALQSLANGVHSSDQLSCQFACPAPVLIPDQLAATYLYRIAQEAVQNAIRHAKPTAIAIGLTSDEAQISLTITDDGCGLPSPRDTKGLGLAIMNYRAHTVGAKLAIRRGAERGTIVRCVLPRDALA